MCQSDVVHVFLFLLETPFLGSLLELLKKFSISYVVVYVKSLLKSVKIARPYHKSVVLKRKQVAWHCYKDQYNK